MNIAVVIPTYAEAETAAGLTDRLVRQVFPRMPNHAFQLVVIDDSEDDRTQALIEGKKSRYHQIHLLRGRRRGLGDAVLRGFRYALERLRPDAIVKMDGDLQHDPADLPRFIAEWENGADCVLGSRFVAGGSLPDDWGWGRTLLARGSNYFMRIVLWPWGILDATSDYRLVRVRGCLDQIDLSAGFSPTSAYRIQLLAELKARGARIKEIPIHFARRRQGSSTMNWREIWESLRVVLALAVRYRKKAVAGS